MLLLVGISAYRHRMKSAILSLFKEKIEFLKVSLAAYLLVALPIALSIPFYIDDTGRSISGIYGWRADGRPLADLVYDFLNLGNAQVSLSSPFGLILSGFGVAFSAILLCDLFNNLNRKTAFVATVLIAAQPFFLQNLSYSFDAPLMICSVFFAVSSAYVILRKLWGWRGGVLSVFLLVCSLSIYQASFSSFLVLVVVSSVSNISLVGSSESMLSRQLISLGRQILLGSSLLNSFLSAGLALIFYKGFVLGLSGTDGYASGHQGVSGLSTLVPTIFGNLQMYFHSISSAFTASFSGWIFFSSILFVSAAYILRPLVRLTRIGQPSLRSFSLSIARLLSVMGALFVSYFPMVVLESPVWAPRTFIGFGFVLAALAVLTLSEYSEFASRRVYLSVKALSSVAVVLSLYYCLLFAYVYPSAYRSQLALNVSVVQRIIGVVQASSLPVDRVSVFGVSAWSPVARNSIKSFPLITSLLGPLDGGWRTHEMFKHYGLNVDFSNDKVDAAEWSYRLSDALISIKGGLVEVDFRS